MSWIKIFSGLLLVRKQELGDLYKTIFLELEMITIITQELPVKFMSLKPGPKLGK